MKGPVRLADKELCAASAPDITLFTATLIGGGAERLLINMAQYFAAQGLKVDLVVCKYVGELKDQVPDNVRLVSLDASKVVFSLPKYLRYLSLAKPRTVISSVERPSIIACFGRMLSRHAHSLYVRMEATLITSESMWKQVYRLPWLALVALSYPAANAIFAISSGIADQLARMPTLRKTPIHFIYNPLITSDFEAKMKETPVYPPAVSPDLPIIIGVGRLHPQKDFPLLIKAFSKVRAKTPCQLVLLGEGPLRQDLMQLAETLSVSAYVHFLGFAKNPLSYIYHANVFVLSSLWEGLPGVLIEALTTGTPLVSTNCRTGPSDILLNGRFGELVPVGDVDALAEAIQKSLSKPKNPMTKELVEHLAQFKVEGVGQKYMSILGLAAE